MGCLAGSGGCWRGRWQGQVAGAGGRGRWQVAGGRWQVAGAGGRWQVAGAGGRWQVAGAGGRGRWQVAGAGGRDGDAGRGDGGGAPGGLPGCAFAARLPGEWEMVCKFCTGFTLTTGRKRRDATRGG